MGGREGGGEVGGWPPFCKIEIGGKKKAWGNQQIKKIVICGKIGEPTWRAHAPMPMSFGLYRLLQLQVLIHRGLANLFMELWV